MKCDQVKPIYVVFEAHVECRRQRDQWDRAAEEDADSEDGKHGRVMVPVHEIVALLPEPWLGILVDLSLHDSKPG